MDQPATAMSSSRGGDAGMGMNCSWGKVMPGSLKLEGSEEEYSFYFMPEKKDEKMFKVQGVTVAVAVDNFGKDMFADKAEVTLVYQGNYVSLSKLDSIAKGHVNPVPI